MKQYAVVTGSSRGLGKSFAGELAQRQINLILISLPNESLVSFGKKMASEYGIDVHCLETDLSNTQNVISVAEKINKQFNVFILINNVGIGGSRKFTDVDSTYIIKMVQINILATTVLTRQLLPNLFKQPEGYVLNVSSLAAYSPIGYKTIYPATKSFIYSFSIGLCQELKDTNVFVSVVNPGPMVTNEDVFVRNKKQSLFGRLAYSDSAKVAKKSIDNIFKRKKVILVNPLSWLLLQIVPTRITCSILTSTMKREIQ
ncbi:SDR family NAD(P)-dependent oxidoreductase [Marixanthomonas spongiae]|uniref:Short-chain dehydrogenase n=1 Tax=Marixanthomonas spongiae TaxID=2174845 RepID=A0A2U0I3Z2_9FLAO|nr:SDR family NAD(P)-dependent oxidoreductase [Marixanthomonas spongiae]PVW15809.1 short-chain dehydrogenase [Marixanthomonas spongiae]